MSTIIVEVPLLDLAQLQESGGATVGGATAVATDDGDTSYIDVAYGHTIDIGGTIFADSTSDAWVGTLTSADIPPGVSIDGITLRITYRAVEWNNNTYPSHRLFITTDPDALETLPGTQPGTVYAKDVADPSLATWVNLSQSADTWQTTSTGLPPASDSDAIRAGGLTVWLYEEGNTTAPTNTVRITEVVALVAYTGVTVAPPLRQYPRSDGLAGSPRRLWPASRSRQRSLRQGPGGYL